MNILITGITGFAGSHLADYILENHKKTKIWGLKRWRSRTENIEHLEGKINLIEGDLKDQTSLTRAIKQIQPERIFHLAAHSFVPDSWILPSETMINNAVGEINLFEAIRECGLVGNCKIQLAGSSEEYGMVYEKEVPIEETNPLRPLSTYGISKVAQDFLGYQYFKSYGMQIVRTRAFNHTGPRRGEVFICSNFAKQLAEIEKGLRDPVVKVGNLDAIRDFTDVRDMVRGYWLALEKGAIGEVYNIGSGKGRSMDEVLSTLFDLSEKSDKIEVVQDAERMRPSDVPILICDYTKFHRQTGWKPEIEFDQTMCDLREYWRRRMK